MAYKTEKLEARIIEKFGTQKDFADCGALPEDAEIIVNYGLSRYISDGHDWKGSTLIKAIRLLEIPEVEIDTYFFAPRVPQKEPKGVKK